MAVYAIGDLQGCAEALERLLDRLRFDPTADRLWFCGDLVNRGPNSIGALRLVHSLGDAAIAVLGNHDLHLLAVAAGVRPARPHKGDTLGPILNADDGAELLAWLARQPLAHYDAEVGWLMVHAGLPPQWSRNDALTYAAEVQGVLNSGEATAWLSRMYGNDPDQWHHDLARDERLRFTVNCLTRMRYCTLQGQLRFKAKGAPGSQPEGQLPWFAVPGRRSADTPIVFGHWSTLGRYRAYNVLGLDTGCVWGGCLTAARLAPHPVDFVEVDCPGGLPVDEHS
ncbi:MAG: symmetrical bis(5'-nucleosyl)-tetraphosphatase [Pseudomonadota bacterium]